MLRKIALFVFLGLALILQELPAQSLGLVWSSPINVGVGGLHDNIRPQIALANGAVPLVIWGSNVGGRKGWVARWNGSAFDTPTQINPSGQINAFTVEGPNITAQGDTAYLVYTHYPATSAKSMIRRSTDGGLTWSMPVWVDSLDTDLPTFTHVGILPGGNPMVMYIHQTATYADPRYVLRTSTDAGQTWGPESVVNTAAPGGEVCDCCTGQPYFHDGKVLATFRNNAGNLRDMWAAVSTDGGATFPTAFDLDSTDWQIPACPSSGPVSTFVGDSIFTAFMSQGGNGSARIFLSAASISNGQLAYNRMLLDTTASFIQNYPAIAGNGDTIVVAWYQSNGSNPEIALRYSFTGVAGLWRNPIQYVTGWATGIQTFPDMAWGNGKLHLVWQDDATNNVKYAAATVGIPAGLSETAAEWRAYPNPSDGRFHLTGLPAEGGLLVVHDLVGHRLYERQVAGEDALELDLSDLPEGVYFLQLAQTSGTAKTLRLAVRK